MDPKKPRQQGRPRLPEGKARSIIIPVRLRPDEHRRLEDAAETEGIASATWARRAVLTALARTRR
jgi:hypothetical protein